MQPPPVVIQVSLLPLLPPFSGIRTAPVSASPRSSEPSWSLYRPGLRIRPHACDPLHKSKTISLCLSVTYQNDHYANPPRFSQKSPVFKTLCIEALLYIIYIQSVTNPLLCKVMGVVPRTPASPVPCTSPLRCGHQVVLLASIRQPLNSASAIFGS